MAPSCFLGQQEEDNISCFSLLLLVFSPGREKRLLCVFLQPSMGSRALLSCKIQATAVWGNKGECEFPNLLSTPYLHSWMELRANTPSKGPEPGRQSLLLAGEILLQQRGYLHEYRLPLWHRACKEKSCVRPLCTSCSHSQLPSYLRTCCCHHQKLFSLLAFYITLFLPNSSCSLGMRSTFFSSLFLFLFFSFINLVTGKGMHIPQSDMQGKN